MSLVTAKSSNSHNAIVATVEIISLQLITLSKLLNGNSGQLRTAILTLGKAVKLQAIHRVCNRLLMIMLIW